MDETTKAYAAGLLDGEGYVGIQVAWAKPPYQSARYRMKVQIQMTDEETIRWLGETFGMNVSTHRPSGMTQRSVSYRVDAQAHRAVAFLQAIRPYARGKARQVELALHFQESCTAWYASQPRTVPSKPMPEDEVERRRLLYEQMRDLNGRARGRQVD